MENPSNTFTEALQAHDGRGLRAAFEACRTKGSHNYDRTTLNRWLAGSMPTNGEAIRCLSEELEDPNIIESWNQQRNQQSPRSQPTVETVVRRFSMLSESDQEAAFDKIRQAHLGRHAPPRTSYFVRIELLDPFDRNDLDHFVMSITLGWRGSVTGDAYALLTTDRGRFGDAYAEPNCLYRELVDLPPTRLERLLTLCDPPTLSIIPLTSTNPQPQIRIGEWRNLTAEFNNQSGEDAEIQLNVQYPISRNKNQFEIRFGRHLVIGGVHITLSLTTNAVAQPTATPFLPAGKERDFAIVPRPKALDVRLGMHSETALSQGNGVVLGWVPIQQ